MFIHLSHISRSWCLRQSTSMAMSWQSLITCLSITTQSTGGGRGGLTPRKVRPLIWNMVGESFSLVGITTLDCELIWFLSSTPPHFLLSNFKCPFEQYWPSGAFNFQYVMMNVWRHVSELSPISHCTILCPEKGWNLHPSSWEREEDVDHGFVTSSHWPQNNKRPICRKNREKPYNFVSPKLSSILTTYGWPLRFSNKSILFTSLPV